MVFEYTQKIEKVKTKLKLIYYQRKNGCEYILGESLHKLQCLKPIYYIIYLSEIRSNKIC